MDRTLVFRRDEIGGPAFVVREPPPAELSAILDAIDGRRSIREIGDALADRFDAASVEAVIAALDGVVLELADPAPDPARDRPAWPAELVVAGSGETALELAAHVAAHGARVRLVWSGPDAPPSRERVTVEPVARTTVGDALRGVAHAIVVHGAGTLGDAIDLNRAALAAGTTAIHVLADTEAIAVGPTTVPFRTPCFECGRIFHYLAAERADGAAAALARIAVTEPADPVLRAALVAAAADRLARELQGLRDGRPYPALLQAVVAISLRHGTRTLELLPTTQCESCRGCARTLTRGPGAIPTLPPLDPSRTIADRAGGVRSVEPLEARRRIEAAARQLGVAITARGYSKRLRARYPALAEVPFVEVIADREFRRDAPAFLGRVVPAYGKGITPEQAICSGMFEFLERHLIMYRGGIDVVRASWREVAAHALDMERLTEGLLDVPDRGSRARFDPDVELDWCWAQCLETGRSLLVPAEIVFTSGLSTAARPTCRFRGAHLELPWRGSSGASAGCTREDAVLQGLYEVLENDARNLQNRTGVAAPAIPPASIDDPTIVPLLRHLETAGFDLGLRYLTRDIGIPVVEAYISSRHDLTFHRVPGYGCHHDAAIAIRRAITEAIHTLGAAEATRPQSLRDGSYSIVNSFHDTQYCVGRVEGELAFAELPAPDPSWTRVGDYITAAVASVKRAIPDAQLCFVDLPLFGLTGVAVVAVVVNGAYDASFHSCLIPARLRELTRHGRDGFTLANLYLGELKT